MKIKKIDCGDRYKLAMINSNDATVNITLLGLIFSIAKCVDESRINDDLNLCNGYIDENEEDAILGNICFKTEEDANRYISILEGYMTMKKLED